MTASETATGGNGDPTSVSRETSPGSSEERRTALVDSLPSADESSLYFRPFMIGDEAFLGVRGAHKAGYYVIASPAGPYFAKGVAPVSIWLSTEYARAAKGGTGALVVIADGDDSSSTATFEDTTASLAASGAEVPPSDTRSPPKLPTCSSTTPAAWAALISAGASDWVTATR